MFWDSRQMAQPCMKAMMLQGHWALEDSGISLSEHHKARIVQKVLQGLLGLVCYETCSQHLYLILDR